MAEEQLGKNTIVPIIIFLKKSIFQYILFWYKKYISFENRYIINSVTIEDDIENCSDYRYSDYQASSIEKKLIKDFRFDQSLEYLSDFHNDQYSSFLIGSRLTYEAKRVFLSYNFAKKVKELYSIKKSIYIWPLDFDIKVFDTINRYNLLDKHIQIHPLAKVYLHIKRILKYTVFIFKTIFYLEFKFITSKFIRYKKTFTYCVQMDDGLIGLAKTPDMLLIDNHFVKKEDIIFTGVGNNNSNWLDAFSLKGYYVNDLYSKMTLLLDFRLISSLYKKFFWLKLKVLKSIILNPSLASVLFNRYKTQLVWHAFYKSHSISKIISTMIADNITASIMHKQNKVKSYFIYLSSTENILDDIHELEYSHIHDYTHMVYDKVLSSGFSNKVMRTLENNVSEYIDIDPILSDIIIEVSKSDNKAHLYDELSIQYSENNPPSRIISVFDSSVGLYSVLSNESYIIFLESILDLTKLYPNIFFLLKTKKDLSYYKHSGIKDKINRLKKEYNFRYVNKYDISPYEVMGISDIVISAPESSIIYESLYAGKKTICYDPLARYIKFKSLSHTLDKCTSYNREDFFELFDYWLNLSQVEHIQYINDNVQKYYNAKVGLNNNIKILREYIYKNNL